MFFSWVILSMGAPLAEGAVLGITLCHTFPRDRYGSQADSVKGKGKDENPSDIYRLMFVTQLLVVAS